MNARHLDDGPCELVKDLLQQKINQLSLQAHRILAFKAELEGYRDRWLTLQIQPLTDEICPLIATVEVPDAAEQPDRPSLVGAVGEQPGLTLRDYPR
jgi:hypothetical protein